MWFPVQHSAVSSPFCLLTGQVRSSSRLSGLAAARVVSDPGIVLGSPLRWFVRHIPRSFLAPHECRGAADCLAGRRQNHWQSLSPSTSPCVPTPPKCLVPSHLIHLLCSHSPVAPVPSAAAETLLISLLLLLLLLSLLLVLFTVQMGQLLDAQLGPLLDVQQRYSNGYCFASLTGLCCGRAGTRLSNSSKAAVTCPWLRGLPLLATARPAAAGGQHTRQAPTLCLMAAQQHG